MSKVPTALLHRIRTRMPRRRNTGLSPMMHGAGARTPPLEGLRLIPGRREDRDCCFWGDVSSHDLTSFIPDLACAVPGAVARGGWWGGVVGHFEIVLREGGVVVWGWGGDVVVVIGVVGVVGVPLLGYGGVAGGGFRAMGASVHERRFTVFDVHLTDGEGADLCNTEKDRRDLRVSS